MADLVLHLLIFMAAAIIALLVPLTIGRFVRPTLPNREKQSIYECGEPTIGSNYLQFDLRFYVVALLFIVFDVEVAFFFPWATVFGPAVQLADERLPQAVATVEGEPTARAILSSELTGIPLGQLGEAELVDAATGLKLAWTAFADVAVFFAVLLVGFAYVWSRGDLDWVRTAADRVKNAAVDRRGVGYNREQSPANVETTPV
ncbi:NADH-quinone oxidoreductase subunit A [Stratiformator vulcanicus]|uniref:NADH-quinone oxidoreductase subunit A n=1 Tax=Stratiformator vulcanicus TaxID=2527980 RepID=A0A517R0I6_9PLAN|nr:NADH-quinone oxidoreductase subunit A [Stratiformator vulcanicus]QDT37407.1 NAD(P)H-quinone oxidoreductase subunit 3 [Stratiformator vulcanicus]